MVLLVFVLACTETSLLLGWSTDASWASWKTSWLKKVNVKACFQNWLLQLLFVRGKRKLISRESRSLMNTIGFKCRYICLGKHILNSQWLQSHVKVYVFPFFFPDHCLSCALKSTFGKYLLDTRHHSRYLRQKLPVVLPISVKPEI